MEIEFVWEGGVPDPAGVPDGAVFLCEVSQWYSPLADRRDAYWLHADEASGTSTLWVVVGGSDYPPETGPYVTLKTLPDLRTPPRLGDLLTEAWLAEHKAFGSEPPFYRPLVVRSGLLDQPDVDRAAARAWERSERSW